MALKLVPPGQRGNKNFHAYGRHAGRVVEYSLQTTDARVAKRRLREFEQRLAAEGPKPHGQATFAEAAARYSAYRQPSRADQLDIAELVGAIGKRRLSDLTVGELHDLAHRLKPGTNAATRNRHVIRIAASIWHYAADAGMCAWVKVKQFPEEKPKTHALSREDAAKLVAGTDEGTDERLLLLWLFHQGMRISHTLAVEWENIDLARGTVAHRERKGRRQHDYVFPLHQAVLEELARVPAHRRQNGRVFPWTSRNSVYTWLPKLCARVGVRFTPHMARHSLGTWLNDEGAGLRTIMETLGHASEQSSLRYQHGNIDTVRQTSAKISLQPYAPNVGKTA